MYPIGILAQKAGCSVPTVRYYESVGLLPQAERQGGGHRRYERPDLARLNFIRRCRDLDIPLVRIKALLAIDRDGRPCAETLSFFKAQRETLKARIRALQELDISLSAYVTGCESGCAPEQPCQVFDELSA